MLDEDKTVKIKKKPDLVRDLTTNAVINTNTSAYERAKQIKAKKLSDAKRLDNLERDVQKILEILTNGNK